MFYIKYEFNRIFTLLGIDTKAAEKYSKVILKNLGSSIVIY